MSLAAGGAAATAATADGSASKFGGDCLEWQMQCLADSALLLQDFRTAYETYGILATDYKAAKTAGHYHAHALLLRALCSALADAPRREVEAALDAAYSQALRAGLPGKAMSVTLLHLELSRRLPRLARPRDAATALVRCSTEVTNLPAALLLEQAALCHLRASAPPPASPATPAAGGLGVVGERKSAFLLVLAGYRYVQAGFRAHAVRCYAAALTQYAGGCM
ncbi:TRAPP III complex [Pavlovales sp. CCMP2436]|nr:TRAPP III complex [Pavlovales sp. CCMP2436]